MTEREVCESENLRKIWATLTTHNYKTFTVKKWMDRERDAKTPIVTLTHTHTQTDRLTDTSTEKRAKL